MVIPPVDLSNIFEPEFVLIRFALTAIVPAYMLIGPAMLVAPLTVTVEVLVGEPIVNPLTDADRFKLEMGQFSALEKLVL